MTQENNQKSSALRPIALGTLVLGLVLLALGFIVHSDILGLLFMVCVVIAVVVFVVDLALRRKQTSDN